MNMNLKDIRLSLKLSQRAFAEALGVSRNYIALIEMGKRMPSKKLIEAASKLSISQQLPKTNDNKEVDDFTSRIAIIEARLASIEQLLIKIIASKSDVDV